MTSGRCSAPCHRTFRPAQRAFVLWRANPRHPSLCFKKTGVVWAVRVARGYRALALLDGDQFCWFWIGSHDEYERLIQSCPSPHSIPLGNPWSRGRRFLMRG